MPDRQHYSLEVRLDNAQGHVHQQTDTARQHLRNQMWANWRRSSMCAMRFTTNLASAPTPHFSQITPRCFKRVLKLHRQFRNSLPKICVEQAVTLRLERNGS
jgi:hypothetical protein